MKGDIGLASYVVLIIICSPSLATSRGNDAGRATDYERACATRMHARMHASFPDPAPDPTPGEGSGNQLAEYSLQYYCKGSIRVIRLISLVPNSRAVESRIINIRATLSYPLQRSRSTELVMRSLLT